MKCNQCIDGPPRARAPARRAPHQPLRDRLMVVGLDFCEERRR